MTRLINKVTGSEMWVADERLNEYLAAGHVPADKADVPQETEKSKQKRVRK